MAPVRAPGRMAAHQAFVGDLEQPLGGALDAADRIHARGIAMPAIDDQGHVDVDDVALAQRLRIGDAVADDVVDRGAGRLGVATIVERGGDGVVVHAVFEDETVDRVGRHARLDDRGELVEAGRGQPAGLAHPFEGGFVVEPDLSGVFERCGSRFEIGDHCVPGA